MKNWRGRRRNIGGDQVEEVGTVGEKANECVMNCCNLSDEEKAKLRRRKFSGISVEM